MKKTLGAVAIAALTLAACSQKAEKPPEAPKEKGHFTISPPKMPTDPVELKATQKSMVESMIADTSLPLDMIEGEAYRRGVTLTSEQIARKKAQKPTKSPVPISQGQQTDTGESPNATGTPATPAVKMDPVTQAK